MTLQEAALAGIYRVANRDWTRSFPEAHFRLFVRVGPGGPVLLPAMHYHDRHTARQGRGLLRQSHHYEEDLYHPYSGPLPSYPDEYPYPPPEAY